MLKIICTNMNKILYTGYRSFSVRTNLDSNNYRFGYHIVLDRFGFKFFHLTDHKRLDNLYTDT
jgi:hypothetical protein